MVKRSVLFLLVLPLLLGGTGVSAQSLGDAEALARMLREEVREAVGRGEREPALLRFYAARDYQPVWVGVDGPQTEARVLWAWLQGAGKHGLNPADYLPASAAALWAQRRPGSLVRLELWLTAGYRRLARHLGQGRWDPARAGTNWHIDPPTVEPLDRLAEVRTPAQLRAVLTGFAPSHPQYRRLQQALERYRALAAHPWPRLDGDGLLRLGNRSPEVKVLRRRLRAEGYPVPIAEQPQHYDAVLQNMVEAFQEDRGLRPDGVVGSRTRAALNLPPEWITAKIAANLERWRWLPRPAAERHLRVNVADYTLTAVEHGREIRTMKVVAGRPERPTPVIGGRISYLVFQPRWTVPPRILREDLAPQELAEPGTLKARGFRVYRGWSKQADRVEAAAVDWQAVAEGRTATAYRVVQQPGPGNALGRVKFMFPNRHSIYLHDTPARDLFDARQRAFSSGCVRVEDPEWLARWLLVDTRDWDAERVRQALARPQTHKVVLNRAVPVYVGYWTVRVGRDGRLRFAADVYQRDTDLVARFATAPTAAVASRDDTEVPKALPAAAKGTPAEPPANRET